MYKLTSNFDDYLIFKNKKIKLNLAYDNVLKCYELFEEDIFSDIEKIDLVLKLLVEDFSSVRNYDYSDKNELVKQIFNDFINSDKKKSSESSKKVFDFKEDSIYIYSSFLMDYGIDLTQEQGKLHWWKFLSLFTGLSKHTKMAHVLEIRTRKIPKPTRYNAEEIKAIRIMKQQYALESNKEDIQEGMKNLFNFFKGGEKNEWPYSDWT